MIEERAIITSLLTNEAAPMVLLQVERSVACGLCGKTSGCGNQVWGKLLGHSQTGFKARNTISAQVGQSVIVAIDEHSVMLAALLLYFVPLVLMLLIALIGQWWFSSNLAAMLGAVIGLLVSWRWMKGWLANRPQAFSYPEVVRLAQANPAHPIDDRCIKQ